MKTFETLGLSPVILKSLATLGYEKPSPIQEQAIPFILKSKKDLIALAQTGTGKTAAFSLPILEQIPEGEHALQAIVICPTRELATQTAAGIRTFGEHVKGLRVVAVYGGESIVTQIRALKAGTNIVVGTPGRIRDLINKKILKLDTIKWVVLDEADEMLDMGFKDDLDAILAETPTTRQTLLFSATMSRHVYDIAKKYMHDVQEISVGTKNVGADKVTHEYYVVENADRFAALQRILDAIPGVYGIVFCRTRAETQEVADRLKQANYSAEAIHGDIDQRLRTKIMDRFRRKQIHMLVATDVAARGIDVDELTHVINYNLSDQNEAYTHRSGRTGRADKSGVSVSIVTGRELSRIRMLERLINKRFEYKKIPTGKDICETQVRAYIEEIEQIHGNAMPQASFFDTSVAKLEHISKEELIRYIISHKFGKLIESTERSRDLNANLRSKLSGSSAPKRNYGKTNFYRNKRSGPSRSGPRSRGTYRRTT